MESRGTLPVSVAVFVLSVAASFVSFAATNSQAQFAALNATFLYVAALVALVGMCVTSRHSLKRSRFGLTSGEVVLLAFGVWAFVSSALSGRLMSAILGEPASLVGLGALAAGAVLALFAARNSDAVHRVMLVGMPILLFAQGVWAMTQAPTMVDAGHGGLGNSSALGLALVLGVPWALANAGEDARRGSGMSGRPSMLRIVGAALLAVFAFAVAVRIESRASAALILAMCVWYLIVRSSLTARVKRISLGAFTGFAAVATVVMAVAERTGRLPFGFLTIRYELWSTALRAVAMRPILGWGADGFFSGGASVTRLGASVGNAPLVFADGTTDPHSLPVFVAVCFGVFGVVLLLALIGLLGHHVIKHRRVTERFDPAVVALVGGIVSLLIMPLTLELLPIIALTLGVCLARPEPSLVRDEIKDASSRVVAPAWAGWSVCAVVGVALTLLTVDAVAVVRLGPVGYFTPAPLPVAARLTTLIPWDPYFSYQANAAFAQVSAPGDEAIRKELWQGLDPARASKLDSRNPYYALAYAQALWNAGRPASDVVAAYQAAISRYPSFPSAHADLALFYATSGQLERARAELAQVQAFGDWNAYPWGAPASAAQRALDTSLP